ncbi:MAG: hypothetical protein FJZ90_16075 [Chloroflexi bacterium]|nr:hypothetical protein [Chloroflexota bacterium]MBM4089359.1 hypothetical protein [Planctomycetota bacterium]
MSRETGNRSALQVGLGIRAVLLAARGDLDGAMAASREQERVCRELNDPWGVGVSLRNQALLLAKHLRRPQEAVALLAEACQLARQHQLPRLMEQIQPVSDLTKSLVDDLVHVCRQSGDQESVLASLAHQARVQYDRGMRKGPLPRSRSKSRSAASCAALTHWKSASGIRHISSTIWANSIGQCLS